MHRVLAGWTGRSALVEPAIDSITQDEESKIDHDYVMMMRNNKFGHAVELETSNNAPLNFFSSRFDLWNLEYNTFYNHTTT